MAQSVERHIGNVEVTGSIPVSSLPEKTTSKEVVFFCLSMDHALRKGSEEIRLPGNAG